MKNKYIIGNDLFETWENIHSRQTIAQRAKLLRAYNTSTYGKWRHGVEPLPKDRVRQMQLEIIAELFCKSDAEAVQAALLTDTEIRQRLTEGRINEPN